MQPRHWIVLIGLGVAGVTSCWMVAPARVGAKYTGPPLATLALPDLDGDGKPELLHVDPDPNGNGMALVRLDASHGQFTHEVLRMRARTSLAVSGDRPRWQLTNADGARAEVRLIQDAKGPQMVVLADGQGKRYAYVERGFLKLDAQTVIPGYSVGLVMVGDDAQALGVLGDKPITQGSWVPAAPPGARFELKSDANGRVSSIVYDAGTLVATNGVRPGVDEQTLEQRFPGRRDGNRWISPQYGMRAVLDGRGRATVLELARPWKDGQEK